MAMTPSSSSLGGEQVNICSACNPLQFEFIDNFILKPLPIERKECTLNDPLKKEEELVDWRF